MSGRVGPVEARANQDGAAAVSRRDALKAAGAIAAAPAAKKAAFAASRLDGAAAAFMARLLK